MHICYYYLIVEPLLPEYHDESTVEPASYAIVKTKSKEYKVSFFANNNQLCMIRIDIPNVPSEIIPEEDLEPIQTMKEHILSVLRLTYDHNVSLFPRPMWNFRKLGQTPSFHVKIDEMINPNFDLHVENIRNVFATTFPIRVQIKLFSDSQDKRLPLQYRYLSLYKLLELEFKKRGKWTNEFQNFINRFEDDFKSLGKDKKLANYVHELRDKCSHIKSKKDILGVTQLSNRDMLEVHRFLPLMTKICLNMINEKYRDKGFSLVNYETFSRRLRN